MCARCVPKMVKDMTVKRSFLEVMAKQVHPSSVLPPRSHGKDVADSVKATGVQQFLIVRPLASKPGEYELIDGCGRLEALRPDEMVFVDVRENVNDVDVYRTSVATFKRTERTTYEDAVFYAGYVAKVKNEPGERGAQASVAKDSLMSESQLSQLLSINELFLKLDQLSKESKFENLKCMGINKLYKLCELTCDEELLRFAKEVEEKADSITIDEIENLVADARDSMPESLRLFAEDDGIAEPGKQSQIDVGVRFQELAIKISAMTKNVDSALSQLGSREMPSRLGVSEKLRTLEKISVSLRRLSYYLGELA